MKLYNPKGLADLTLVSGTAAQAERTFDADDDVGRSEPSAT